MGRTKKVGPSGRFKARYGGTVRKRAAEIEVVLKKAHECPSCGVRAVKRVSVGVWRCGKCGYTFTGGAYTPYTKLGEIAKRSARGGSSTVRAGPSAPKSGEEEAQRF